MAAPSPLAFSTRAHPKPAAGIAQTAMFDGGVLVGIEVELDRRAEAGKGGADLFRDQRRGSAVLAIPKATYVRLDPVVSHQVLQGGNMVRTGARRNDIDNTIEMISELLARYNPTRAQIPDASTSFCLLARRTGAVGLAFAVREGRRRTDDGSDAFWFQPITGKAHRREGAQRLSLPGYPRRDFRHARRSRPSPFHHRRW